MSNIQLDKKNFHLITFYPVIFLFIIFFVCTGMEPKSQAKEQPPVSSGADSIKTPEEPLILSRETYSNYFLATLYISQGDYKKAKACLEKVYKKDPESLYLNRKMAILQQKTGDLKGALKFARECIKIDPKDINSHMLLAELSALNGDKTGEKEEYEAILNLDPKQQRIRFLLATYLIKNNKLDEAMQQLDRLVTENPDLPFVHYYKGRVYLELGNYNEAENEYLKTLDLDGTFEPALFDLASLYQSQKKLEESVQLYKKLVGLYPNNRTAQERLIGIYNTLGQTDNIKDLIENIQTQSKPGDPGRQTLGIYYLQKGRFAEAIAEFDLIVQAWPEDDKSRYLLSLAYEESSLPEKALEHLRLIKQTSEYYINSQVHIAYILSDMGKNDESVKVLQKAISIKQNDTSLYLVLSSLYEEKKEYKNAVETLQEGVKHNDKDTDLLFRLGIELDKSGDKHGCIIQMKKVLELDPNHTDSLNYIAYSYADEGINLDEAMAMIQRALKLKPDSGFIIDSLGWVYFRKGLYDEALNSLQKAFSLNSNDPTIAEHLGDAYLKKNEYQHSLEMYQKALSLKHEDTDKILEKINEVKKLLE